MLATGACAYGGQFTLTSALRLVEAAPATAMSYLTVVWGLLLGFAVFQEVTFLPKEQAFSSQKHFYVGGTRAF